MIAFIKNHIRRMRDARIAVQYGSGFYHAAGCLLQGVTPTVLENEVNEQLFVANDLHSIEYDAFNAGVIAACREWRGRVCLTGRG